jgi:5,5'-dehydrodivanillate O-demethylase oxygenase subunit
MNQAENELMTRVAAGTPCGDMLRRYWWPIACSADVGKKPVPVRLLGENFILFRDGSGAVGLLNRRCMHRGASLEFGRVEKEGLRCCYHGWLFDTQGNCLDMPCEPKNSTLKNRVHQPAYQTRDVSGFVFAYIGPDPAPEFPKFDLIARDDFDKVVMGRDAHSNWLQRAENMLDALHVMCLHAPLYPELAMQYPTRCVWDEKWYGFQMELDYPNGTKDRHHHFFPAGNRIQISRVGQQPFQFIQWCTPIDDNDSVVFQLWASPTADGAAGTIKTAKHQKTTFGGYKRVEDGWWDIWERDQDDAAVESQGLITDRTAEHLGTSDLGIVKFRRMLLRSIEAVQRGEDPINVIRAGDGHDGLIDLHAYKTELGQEYGEVRRSDVGDKLKIIAPHDF